MKALDSHQNLGLDISFNEYNLGKSKDLVNKAIDWFFELYYLKHTVSDEEKNNKRTVKYSNDIEADIPVWYLEFQGHDLEERLKTAFPALEKYRDEGKLQKDLSIISAKCYPFIHQDTVDVIARIVNAS